VRTLLALALLGICILGGCDRSSQFSGMEAPGVIAVQFCRSVGEVFNPDELTDVFEHDEIVFVVLTLDGEHTQGEVTASFRLNGQDISLARIHLAHAKPGVIAVADGETVLGFLLRPSPSFPPGGYTVEFDYDGLTLGEYSYTVKPPRGTECQVLSVEVATEPIPADDGRPWLTNLPRYLHDQEMIVTGHVAVSPPCWLHMSWSVEDTVDEVATRTLTYVESSRDAEFRFTNIPKGGWPAGRHEARLLANGVEALHYPFEILENEAL